MSQSRIRKIRSSAAAQQDLYDVFYMSPEEAKRALEQKYEFLADRYATRYPKHKGLN